MSYISFPRNARLLSGCVGCLLLLNLQPGHTADITNKNFTLNSSDCADHSSTHRSSVTDVNRNKQFPGNITIKATEDRCFFQSNAIPNHDFNDGSSSFRNNVSEQSIDISVPRNPQIADETTPLSLSFDNAIFLNGVKLDLLAAACYGVGNQSLGNEKIGCGDRDIKNPWRYDPLSSFNNFGTDSHHAHAQPDGTYHYHAGPHTLFNDECDTAGIVSPVIGFAADGFPIHGPCATTDNGIRKLTSSYVMRKGVRQPETGYKTPEPAYVHSANYDGQFRGDYEFLDGSGDLDECNGTSINGQYGYYVTDAYPWVMACFRGTPDDSFAKRRRR